MKKRRIIFIVVSIIVLVLGICFFVKINNSEERRFKKEIYKIKEDISSKKQSEQKIKNDEVVPSKYRNMLVATSEGQLIYIGDTNTSLASVAASVGVGSSEILNKIKTLNDLAIQYKNANSSSESTAKLCLQYVRRNRYNSTIWSLTAGNIDEGFVNYVATNNSELANYDFNTAGLTDPVTGSSIDFAHMCATLNAILNNSSSSNDLSKFAGWAGDLTTLMEQVINYDNGKSDAELLAYAKQLLATKNTALNSTFDIHDMLADIDAVNLYDKGYFNDDSLYNAILKYYFQDNDIITKRNDNFANSLGGKENIRSTVNGTFTSFIGKICVSKILSSDANSKYNDKHRSIVATAFSDYFNTTNVANVTSIKIKTEPAKKNYIKGEDLNFSGGTLEVSYDDGSTKEIGITDSAVTITGYDKTKEGEQTLTITYQGKTTTTKVTVTNNMVGMSIKNEPIKKNYIKGQDLNLAGGTLEITYQDGSKKELAMTDKSVTVTGYDKTKEGEQTLTITYQGKTATMKVVVTNNMTRIAIKSEPTKKTYIKGEELNLTGGSLELIYEDGSKKEIAMTDKAVTVTGYDKTKEGEQTLTITYQGKTATMKIVVENPVTGVAIKAEPTKKSYVKGEELNLVGGILEITYEDGSKKEIEMTDKAVIVTGYDKTKEGEQTITIAYQNKTVTIKVNVTNSITGITVKKEISKKTYIKGEELNLVGGTIEATYQDGSKKEVGLTDSGVVVTGYDKTKEGEQTLTITYQGKATTMKVNVTNNITTITIKTEPKKKTYIKGQDLDVSDGILEVTYQDGTKKEVAMSDKAVTITGYDKTKEGEQTLTIAYQGKTVTMKINVTNSITDVIVKAEPKKKTYIKGQNLDLSGGVLEITYEDGSKKEIQMTDKEVTVTGYDKTKEGEQVLTITYQGKTVTIKVNVTNYITAIAIKTEPNKKKYIKGQDLDLSGGTLEATYQDGSKKEIAMTDKDVVVEGYDKTKEGEQILTIKYQEKTITMKIIVTNDMTGIVVKTEPKKMSYIKGQELDLSGGILEITYEDGTKKEIQMTDKEVTIEGYDKTKEGQQILTIKYQGKTTTMKVTVTNKITGIVVKNEPKKISYIKGEDLDLLGGTIEATYEDETKKEIEMTDKTVTVEGYDKTEEGEQTLKITYQEKTTTMKVIVTNKVTEIKVKNEPTKKNYTQGDELDLSGGTIEATYEDGSKKEIEMTDKAITVEGYDKAKEGEQTVEIIYDGIKTSINVNVAKKQVKNDANNNPKGNKGNKTGTQNKATKNTNAKGLLPKTGISKFIVFVIIVVSSIAIILYKKYKKLNEIK